MRAIWTIGFAGCSWEGEPETVVVSAVSGPEVRLHPEAERVPANAVHFQLRWSEPMALGPHGTEIRRSDGSVVGGAVDRLVWDENVQVARLSPSLEPGVYTLHVAGFVGKSGETAGPVDFEFEVVPADTIAPLGDRLAVQIWAYDGDRRGVSVRFPEPMSYESLGSLTVLSGGTPVEGDWDLFEGDSVALFVPRGPGPADPVFVSFGAGLTDLAGNEMVHRPEGMVTPSDAPDDE